MSFREKYSLLQRQNESNRLSKKFKDRIPVIVERMSDSNVPEIDKHKFLIPLDMSVGQFAHVLRKRIKLTHEQALFLFVNNTLPPTSLLMSQLYTEHKGEDGLLLIEYAGESVFGCNS